MLVIQKYTISEMSQLMWLLAWSKKQPTQRFCIKYCIYLACTTIFRQNFSTAHTSLCWAFWSINTITREKIFKGLSSAFNNYPVPTEKVLIYHFYSSCMKLELVKKLVRLSFEKSTESKALIISINIVISESRISKLVWGRIKHCNFKLIL